MTTQLTYEGYPRSLLEHMIADQQRIIRLCMDETHAHVGIVQSAGKHVQAALELQYE